MASDPERRIRVFVSSTFQDMHEEREELVKRVFPRLRKLCEARGVVWGEVDLRWGIPDEQKAEGQVLPVCLAEIQRCRPYFIGMLGERYGWVPDGLPADVVLAEPWLHGHDGSSITELEILHGVLNDPEMAGHAFFYFRDPAYLESLPEPARSTYRDEPTAGDIARPGEAAARDRARARRRKLARLKERIRLSGFPVREDYPDPRALGDLVLADLSDLIDRLFPAGEVPDPLDRERAEHEAFAAARMAVYVARPDHLGALDAHARGDGPPLVVLGEPGSGKSALLANWLARRPADPAEVRIVHHVGATAASTDWISMARRLMGELGRQSGIHKPIPDHPAALREALAQHFRLVALRRRIVLVLDGLDQLEDRDGAPDLVWLPADLPAKLRLVLSTLPGRPLQELGRRGWPTFAVTPLAPSERREVVRAYLDQFAKRLPSEQVDRIVGRAPAANPLYLKALLEELRQHGRHDTLPEAIDHYLGADGVPALYERILARWERDYDRDRPGLVRDALVLVWAGRRGLAEPELLELLGKQRARLPQAHWSPLHLAAENALVSRSGLLTFFHDGLRQAVTRRYLRDRRARRRAHRRLAEYFGRRELGPRVLDELPWQLARAEAWDRLESRLSDLNFLTATQARDEFDVKRFWALLEAHSPYRMPDTYRSVIRHPGTDPGAAWAVAGLLAETGYPEEALQVRRALVAHHRGRDEPESLQAALGNLALVLLSRGDLDEAGELLEEQEAICRQAGREAILQAALGNRALIPLRRGAFAEAMAYLEEQEAICRQIADRSWLQACLGNQAIARHGLGDYDRALDLLEEQERLCRELQDWGSLQACLGNQALVFRARGDLEGAMALRREEERICRELGDLAGLQACLGNQAVILKTRGMHEGAMALLSEQERICRRIGHRWGLRSSLGNQALILQARGDLDGALALHREEEAICRELGTQDGLRICLGNQSLIYLEWEDHEQALLLATEQERLARAAGSRDGLRVALDNQGLILRAMGDLSGALERHREQERLCLELGSREGLQEALGNRAIIASLQGDHAAALELLGEQERICAEIGDVDGLATSLWQQGVVLGRLARPAEALFLLEEAGAIARDHGLALLRSKMAPDLERARARTGS